MDVEQNIISRDWIVRHEGRVFYVNYTNSDGQTLALCNRDYWKIEEETDEGIEELDIYIFNSNSQEERKRKEHNNKLFDELTEFCMKEWDNHFMEGIKKDFRKALRG